MAKINPIEPQKSLKGVHYPASKADVVSAAEQNGAGEQILEAVMNVSDDSFETPAAVGKALGDEM